MLQASLSVYPEAVAQEPAEMSIKQETLEHVAWPGSPHSSSDVTVRAKRAGGKTLLYSPLIFGVSLQT